MKMRVSLFAPLFRWLLRSTSTHVKNIKKSHINYLFFCLAAQLAVSQQLRYVCTSTQVKTSNHTFINIFLASLRSLPLLSSVQQQLVHRHRSHCTKLYLTHMRYLELGLPKPARRRRIIRLVERHHRAHQGVQLCLQVSYGATVEQWHT
jgi:hypothetical protein